MQTSYYATDQDLGVEGQCADTIKCDSLSLKNSESAGVGFGLGVVDKGDGTFEEPDALTKKVRGVLLHSHAYANTTLDPAGVPTKQVGDVCIRGRCIVYPEVAVAAGDEAYCRFADGIADPTKVTKGKWRNDDDTSTAMHVNNARFRSAATAGKPAILELLDGVGEADIVYVDAAVGALAATTTIELGAVPSGRHVKVRSATLSCGATGDSPNHWVFEVKSSTTVLASYSTATAAQGTITQNTPKAMVVAAAAGKSLERLTLLATKNGTAAALTAGQLMVELEVY